jgi:hypothetical protein
VRSHLSYLHLPKHTQPQQTKRLASYNATKSQLLQQQSKLKKDSLWLSIGALLGGFLLFNVWRYADWTRIRL